MLLYIVRHGHPDYTTDSLTERGWLQAEAVGKRLAATGIDQVYASPMGRARQTAEPTCRLLDQPYNENCQLYVIDGFILSPNVRLESVQTQDLNFENSDHNPVRLQVTLAP